AAKDPLGLRTFVVYGNDRLVAGSSEIGSIPIPPEELTFARSLEGGEILIVKDGEVRWPDEVEAEMAQDPYLELKGNATVFHLNTPAARSLENGVERFSKEELIRLWNQAGGDQHAMAVLRHIATEGKEKVMGMGDDRPLAVFSGANPRTAEYFKQMVAVVTNPPFDSKREGEAMDLTTYLGRSPKQTNADSPQEYQTCPELKMKSPIMNPDQFRRMMKRENAEMPATITIHTTVEGSSGADIQRRLDEIIEQVIEVAQTDKTPIIVFSDRNATQEERLFVPPVFIVSAIDDRLKKKGVRDNVKLVFDTMDAFEGHDIALLISQGADAVNPYLVWQMATNDLSKLGKLSEADRLGNIEKTLDESLKVIMAKMGIITIGGYRGSCLFEALGIDSDLSVEYIPNNVSRLSGLTFDDIARDQLERLEKGGERLRTIKKTEEASAHRFDIKTAMNGIGKAAREGGDATSIYKGLLELVDARDPIYLRDLFRWVPAEERGGSALEVDQVMSRDEIINRHFRGAAMSDGSLNPVGHAAIAGAFNEFARRMPGDYDGPLARSNSGEGGESAFRYPGGSLEEACSRTKQIASGRFGVDANYVMSVGKDGELNIKIGQGAKPGEGGQLNGNKVDERIAAQRGTIPGSQLVSPPPHHDIYSIEDLMRLIWDLRAVNPDVKTVSVKITTKAGVGTISIGIAKCGANKIVLSGRVGGTGAAKTSALHHTGGILELGLMESHLMLEASGMRDEMCLEVDGGILTGRDIVKLAILGADEFGFGSALLMAGQGCIFCNQCATNKCPKGITTQDPEYLALLALGEENARKFLASGGNPLTFVEQYETVKRSTMHYLELVAGEVREILAELGYQSLEEIRGHVELLKRIEGEGKPWDRVDTSFVHDEQNAPEDIPNFEGLPIAPREAVNAINRAIVEAAASGQEIEILELDSEQSIAATLAGKIASGEIQLPEGGYQIKCKGYAGQSFGFMIVPGINLELDGIARDFVGEGACGGKIVIRPPQNLRTEGRTPLAAGASCAYGARGIKLFAAGKVGQRFGVKAALGTTLVCEGAGKYAFEYTTGITGVVLTEDIEHQIGTGMSAGELFLWDENGSVEGKLHGDSVRIAEMTPADEERLKTLLEEYLEETRSPRAVEILADWEQSKKRFSKVISCIEPHRFEPSESGERLMEEMRDDQFPIFQ
ncbi:MAG: glutamate synthase-related protein, partial [Candidatus Peregrinibacteria bacterium]|nr:glutamate synthase-related protein [Candidatus Peregrinibacteria bacterium]